MDSDSIGDRLKEMQISESDDIGNVNESVEEDVPKILNPGVRDVFHIFASMLDVKSFMKLAMTSKKMYKRCMEDTEIGINVDVDTLAVSNREGSVKFEFFFPDVSHRQRDGFIDALRKLPCMVKLRTLEITFHPEILKVVYKYLKEIGVNKIHELRLYFDDEGLETIFAIIKDFDVNAVSIYSEIKEDILRSFLQLNLEKLTYNGKITVNYILEIDSPIREICFPGVNRISKEELMDILSKIQSGSLRRLSLNKNVVDWDEFETLPFDHEGPLPEGRPLVLDNTTYDEYTYLDSDSDYAVTTVESHEYWFLHWNGGVTNCCGFEYLEISKCDPCEYPFILRKEEDILKDLAERRPKVSCSAEQFRTFCKSLSMIDSSHQGPLPDDRPLFLKPSEKKDDCPHFFKHSAKNFWLLDEDDQLMRCTWEDGFATWKPYILRTTGWFRHPALAKYMFWKVLEQLKGSDEFTFYSIKEEEFDSWFVNFNSLPFEYSGPLPSGARPLVFERSSSEAKSLRVVLFYYRLLQCEYSDNDVSIKICHYLNRPSILFRAKNVLEILQDFTDISVSLNVQYEEFLDGLNQFKRSSLVLQKRILISELVANEFWYWMEDAKRVRKVAWKGERLSIDGGDLRGSPSGFMAQIFKYYAEANYCTSSLKMELEEFRSCLEQFSPVPFDYVGTLTGDSSLAFVKNEIHHTCNEVLLNLEEVTCQCSEVSSVLVWLLWKGLKVTKCSWGENKPKEVLFERNFIGMPPAFKSKEYLKFLLQEKYDKSTRFEWFGSAEDFRAYLEDYKKLPFDYDGPLPDERPLLFFTSTGFSIVQLLLRADGAIIRCTLTSSSVKLSLLSFSLCVPRALKGML